MARIINKVYDPEIENGLAELAEEESEKEKQRLHRTEVLEYYEENYGVPPESYEIAEDAWRYANDRQYRSLVNAECALFSPY